MYSIWAQLGCRDKRTINSLICWAQASVGLDDFGLKREACSKPTHSQLAKVIEFEPSSVRLKCRTLLAEPRTNVQARDK